MCTDFCRAEESSELCQNCVSSCVPCEVANRLCACNLLLPPWDPNLSGSSRPLITLDPCLSSVCHTSTASRTIVTYVNDRWTTVCTYTIVRHKLGKVGTIYWSIVMYINNGQMCALTFPGRGSVVRLVLLYQAPCCALFVVITVVLATEICTAW